jgi:hypothetical protein
MAIEVLETALLPDPVHANDPDAFGPLSRRGRGIRFT